MSAEQAQPVMPAMTPEQFQQFLAAMVGQNAQLAEAVTSMAGSLAKQRPENVDFPDVSAYNPLGQRDHPKPDLPCPEVYFGGFPVELDQLDYVEALLVALLKPGVAMVTRTDGEQEEVPIGFKVNGAKVLERITIQINTGKDYKDKWPGMREVLAEVLQQQGTDVYPLPKRKDVADTIAWIQRISEMREVIAA